MTKYTKTERDEAMARLRECLEPGDTVYTILESRAKSGMSRWIRVVLIDCAAGEGWPDLTHPNHDVAVALGLRRDRDHAGMFIPGLWGDRAHRSGACGMDMGFEIVYRLGEALWPDGTPGPGGKPTSGGRALNHRWL